MQSPAFQKTESHYKVSKECPKNVQKLSENCPKPLRGQIVDIFWVYWSVFVSGNPVQYMRVTKLEDAVHPRLDDRDEASNFGRGSLHNIQTNNEQTLDEGKTERPLTRTKQTLQLVKQTSRHCHTHTNKLGGHSGPEKKYLAPSPIPCRHSAWPPRSSFPPSWEKPPPGIFNKPPPPCCPGLPLPSPKQKKRSETSTKQTTPRRNAPCPSSLVSAKRVTFIRGRCGFF